MSGAASTERESPVTIVVTAVGAIIGQGIVTSLRQSGNPVRIIGVDRNPDGIGRHFCDHFIAKPAVAETSKTYLDFWFDLLQSNKVDLVLPGLESDVLFFNSNRDHFQGLKAKIALNTASLIDLAQDKWDFGLELAALGLPVIPASLDASWHACVERLGAPPLLIKPRRGNGSRGIAVLADEADFAYHTAKSRDPWLIQAYVGSDDAEYTVGAFGLGDGTSLTPIIFRRRLSVAGNTNYAEVVEHPLLVDTVNRLACHFKPVGPTNYQFRMAGDIPYLLEINPRFSSSTSLRSAFGYNEAAMSVSFYLDGTRPPDPVVVPGHGWRYQADLVIR